MNGQKFKGRIIAVEFSVPKEKYESKVANILSNTKMTRQDAVIPKVVKEATEEEAKAKIERQEKRNKDKKAKFEKKLEARKKLQLENPDSA